MNLELQPEDLNADDWPVDWDTESNFHGMSRSTSNRRYHVRLSVVGKQFFIATASTQLKGARLYDMALWKLAPFLPRIHPNFPTEFNNLTQSDVDAGCPGLNALYSQVETAISPQDDLTERERREAAIERMGESKKFKPQPSVKSYEKYQKTLHRLRVQLVTTLPRITAERINLNFTKFPALQLAAAEYESKLREAESSCAVLHDLLTTHADIYKHLVYETN